VITVDDIRDASQKIRGTAKRTPVLTSRSLNDRLGAETYVKAEGYQRTGSFKFRGAFNRASRLSPDELRRGVLTFSSGNHAAALARVASILGTRAVIVMPYDAPESKRAATESYGAQIVGYDRYTQSREEIASAIAEKEGMTIIPPFDDPHIIAGQGTVAAELFEDADHLDVLLVPVGGGGLIAGCGTLAKAINPRIHLVGVEPELGDDTKRSLAAGSRVRIDIPKTIADGLQASTPGELTFEINKENVDEIALVSDREIVDAMRFLFQVMKVVAEPSGAISLAAALSGKLDVSTKRVGVVISGGNVDLNRLCELVA
jgi:threonine dehydratase